MFTENQLFEVWPCFMTSLLRHTFDVCTYFGIFGKRRHIAIVPIRNVFKNVTMGGNHPFGKPGYRKKVWLRRGLIYHEQHQLATKNRDGSHELSKHELGLLQRRVSEVDKKYVLIRSPTYCSGNTSSQLAHVPILHQ